MPPRKACNSTYETLGKGKIVVLTIRASLYGAVEDVSQFGFLSIVAGSGNACAILGIFHQNNDFILRAPHFLTVYCSCRKLDTTRGFISYMRRTDHAVPRDYVIKALLRACEKRDVWHAESFWRLYRRCFDTLPSDAGCRAFLRALSSRGNSDRVCTAMREVVDAGRTPSESYFKSIADGFVESQDLDACREAFASLAQLLEASGGGSGESAAGESAAGESTVGESAAGEPSLTTIAERYGELAEQAIQGRLRRVRSPASVSRRPPRGGNGGRPPRGGNSGGGNNRQSKRRSQQSLS